VGIDTGMRILLLADIHANWAALSAIREPFDACLVLGDLVEYGPDASRCIDWVMRNAHVAVRGNHDHSTSQNVASTSGAGCKRLAALTRELHRQTLTSQQLKFLARLPVTATVQLDDKTFYLVHATPRDPMDEYLTHDPQAWAQRLQGIEADFICVGHTHLPMHLEFGSWQVVNPGSVGQPRDGDPRASYAVIEDGRVTFHRVSYDVEATIAGLRDARLPPDVLELAEHVLRTGGRPAAQRTLQS
jgi:putative phosphoesterase